MLIKGTCCLVKAVIPRNNETNCVYLECFVELLIQFIEVKRKNHINLYLCSKQVKHVIRLKKRDLEEGIRVILICLSI